MDQELKRVYDMEYPLKRCMKRVDEVQEAAAALITGTTKRVDDHDATHAVRSDRIAQGIRSRRGVP